MLYGRIDELLNQLERLCTQDYAGTWDIILWNNDFSKVDEINTIVAPFYSRLKMRVVHSAHNYHCMARTAVAALAECELVLMMDDDVIPERTYLSEFASAYERVANQRGDLNFALCACGHRFGPSAAGAPASMVWEQRQGLQFLDQTAAESDVDFAHGNNFLIARTLFLQAAARPMPNAQFGLVDDYWFSYVLCHHLHCTLVKISLPDAFVFSDSAFEPARAMFYRKDVHAARLAFFAYHVQCGWPSLIVTGAPATP